jgi:hypothetical protein
MPDVLYRLHELAFRTQYAELKERCASAGRLLPGTPGRLVLRKGTGRGYWYRAYYPVPGREVEAFVCKADDALALEAERQRIAFAGWVARQARDLRKLQFQVADKAAARVLVELHNAGLFAAGLVVVGTLGYMAWLNELGGKTIMARTQDVDLARRQRLRLAAPLSFWHTMEATRIGFSPVPKMSPRAMPTAVKRHGVEGLRVDMLTPGEPPGHVVSLPEMEWHAQAVPFYDYLLRGPREAAVLAGGHCVPVWLPAPERFVWHKLYSSAARRSFPEKAQKDLVQAATLAALLVEQDDAPLAASARVVPVRMMAIARSRWPALRGLLAHHEPTLEQFRLAFERSRRRRASS